VILAVYSFRNPSVSTDKKYGEFNDTFVSDHSESVLKTVRTRSTIADRFNEFHNSVPVLLLDSIVDFFVYIQENISHLKRG